MNSNALGSVKITSRDPDVKPALRFNYLSTDQDLTEWVQAIAVARKILRQPAFAEFDGGESRRDHRCRPTRRSSTGSARTPRRRFIRRAAARWERTSSPSSTPRRWVSAGSTGFASWTRPSSSITNANLYAPVTMVAEKAADLILGNTPLPPEPVPFYRHRKTVAPAA